MKRLMLVGVALVASLVTIPAVADLVLSGQVTPAVLFGGDVDDAEIVDNTGTGSRIRLKGEEPLGELTTFTRYEIQIQENNSFGAVDGGESIDTRYAEVGVKGAFGSLSLGKGDGAANATAEGSYQVSGNLLGGGHLTLFTLRGALNRDNTAQVGYTYYDGFSRNSRIRYDSPNFGGVVVSASLDSGDRTEIAARLKRELGPGKITLLGGLAESSDGNNDRTMLSGGYRFNSGFSFAFSLSSRTQDAAPDLDSQLLSVNYQIGKLVLSVDLGEQGLDGENEISQVGFEYHALKTFDVYAGLATFDNADDTSLDAGFAGFRYKF